MSDNEVEEVSFLPGASAKNKRAVYEPSGPQRCKQLVCSKEIAITVGVVVCAVILAVAFIAAFARPEKGKCNLQEKLLLTTTTLTVEPHPKYITKNGKKFPWENVRLPTSVIPLHYDIFLHPNLTMSVTKGRVTITCRVVKDTNFVVFHIKQLNVTEFSVQSKTTGKNIMAKDYLHYEPNDQMYIELERKLSQGEEFDLLVYFEGALIEQLSGFYKSSYQTKAGETRYIASTMFESTDARKGFPCFDEPLLKANFSLSMVREPDYISLFNMPLSSSKLYREGLMLDKFQTSFKMSTYLVAFVVCDFANITQWVSNRIMVRAFAPRDLIQDVEFALKTAVHILEYYETFFGVQYPLPKQDMIAIPDFAAGAMENWGLIAYNTKAILYNSEISSVNDKIWVAVVVAHELAHQWFGNLVTMEWWDDLWLNEGFATFVENIGVNQILSDSHMDDQFVLKSLHKSLLMDSLSNSHPIHFNIIDPNMIQEAFDDISYDKGAAILRMLQHFMGENFRKGLISYLKKYEFANANTDDLWNSLSQSFTGKGVDIKAVMDTWIKQKGYPLVTLKSQGDTIVASQTRFLLSPKSKEITGQQPSPFKYNWYIPFTYITSKNTSLVNTVWMNMTSVTFSVPADITWIKGNSHAYGFYRVNYEESNWKKLISQLTTNHLVFSVSDRAALIDDMFNLGRAGKVKYSFVLDMTEYLVNEEEYVPLASALSQFYNIFFLLDGRPARRSRLFEKYLLKLIVPKIQKLGWTDDEGPLLQRFLRNEVLCAGVLIGHTETVNKGVALFQEWMLQNKSISPNLKNVVYLAGIMYGNEKSWQFCWKKYQDAIDPSEKEKLLQALSHTSNSELKYRLLEYSLDRDKVRPQDSHLAITSGARSRTGRILAWDFLKRNWEKIFKRYGEKSFIFQNLLKGVPSHFSSEFDYNEVKEFFRDRNVGSGKIALQQTLENIQSNIEWLKTYEKEVSQWLAKHGQ